MTASKLPRPTANRKRKRSSGGHAPRVNLAQELEADSPMEVDDPSQLDSPLTTPPSSPATLKPKPEGHPHNKVSDMYLPEVAVTDLR